MIATRWQRAFSGLGLAGVALGAFGAHALKDRVGEGMLENWKTATLYLFVHVLAGYVSTFVPTRPRVQLAFLTGIVLFSGSLYVLVLTGQRALGAVAPLGGVSFMLGWLFLFLDSKNAPDPAPDTETDPDPRQAASHTPPN